MEQIVSAELTNEELVRMGVNVLDTNTNTNTNTNKHTTSKQYKSTKTRNIKKTFACIQKGETNQTKVNILSSSPEKNLLLH